MNGKYWTKNVFTHIFTMKWKNLEAGYKAREEDWLIIKTERGESLIPESRLSTCSFWTLLYQTLYIQQYGQVLVFWTDKGWLRKVFDCSSCPTITTTSPTNITSSCQGMVDYVVIFNLQCVSECDNGHETENKTQNGRLSITNVYFHVLDWSINQKENGRLDCLKR